MVLLNFLLYFLLGFLSFTICFYPSQFYCMTIVFADILTSDSPYINLALNHLAVHAINAWCAWVCVGVCVRVCSTHAIPTVPSPKRNHSFSLSH